MKSIPPYKLINIQWHDSRGCYVNWHSLNLQNENAYLCIVYSVGWETYRDKQTVILTPNISDEQGCGDIVIPVSAILKEFELSSV